MRLGRMMDATTLGLALPSGIAVGLFFGYWLDKWLGTAPWMLIIWTLLGVASGLISLIRGIAKYTREAEREEKSRPRP